MSDDHDWFLEKMQAVDPLKPDKPRALAQSVLPPKRRRVLFCDDVPHVQGAPSFEPTCVEAGESHAFLRQGVQRDWLARLQGSSPTCVLDVHGLTVDQAYASWLAWRDQALAQGRREVWVIHGDGRSQGDRFPKLKNAFYAWLRQDPWVLAFVCASPRHGGTGATVVRLKRQSA